MRIEITEEQAKALYDVLPALEDATAPTVVEDAGAPFDGAPSGGARRALRGVWWKVAKALGHAE